MRRLMSLSCFAVSLTTIAAAAPPDTLYDEELLPRYTLPDPLVCEDGTSVSTKEVWMNKRRPEILKMFEEEVYGRAPAAPEEISFHQISEDNNALGGKAIRREVEITLVGGEAPVVMTMLIYQPHTDKPVPAFLGLSFYGNETITAEPGIRINPNWMRSNGDKGIVKNRATEKSRGKSSSRWPVEMIVGRGYALATIYYGDIDPDVDDDFQNGIHPHFNKRDQEKPAPDEWGAIAAWAWGLSRGLDYLEIDPTIDAKRVAVFGHSRLGKTSLWAGAADERFALVISNNSGCGGAALSRRRYGESVKRINASFPHWFCDNFVKYNHNEDACPVDQHQLIALMAPRPVYVASAEGDQWADPIGEYLSCFHADPVYRLLDTDGLGGDSPSREMPKVDEPRNDGIIGYHIRSGKHDVTDFDWKQYLKFADQHLKKKRESGDFSR